MLDPEPNRDAAASPGVPSLHSRSEAAGYRPATLFGATLLVVGEGALGQNVTLDLALAGVGRLILVDFDTWSDHNATRSPFFPTPDEQQRWGVTKVRTVAERLRAIMTAPRPQVFYAAAPVQELGDLPLQVSDLVISAVDTPAARAWLAERCRFLGKPLLEGGFHGPEMNFSLFGTGAEEPCYRCLNPHKEGAFSCTRYALQAEKEGIIPAIQNTAAVLGGLMAEQAIQWLHGSAPLRGRRAYLNVQTAASRVVQVTRDPQCPGWHETPASSAIDLELPAGATAASIAATAERAIGACELRLPEPFIVRIACTRCASLVAAGVPEWRWLLDPRCVSCGGTFPPAAAGRAPSTVDRLYTDYLDADIASHDGTGLGFAPGSAILARSASGEVVLLRRAGALEDITSQVAACPAPGRLDPVPA